MVIFKAGRTPSAARAALTHTGFFAGSYKVAEGAFRQAGLIAVDSYEELVAVSKALALQPRARGNRVAMIGNGIGTTVQALDILAGAGLELATLAPATIDRLTEIYPSFYIVQNPLDVTGSGTSTDYEIGIQALLDDPGVDIVMPWMVFQDAPLGERHPGEAGPLEPGRAQTDPWSGHRRPVHPPHIRRDRGPRGPSIPFSAGLGCRRQGSGPRRPAVPIEATFVTGTSGTREPTQALASTQFSSLRPG